MKNFEPNFDTQHKDVAPILPEAISRSILNVAPVNVDICIEGETGSGKDMLAMHIHNKSKRIGPFVAVNCAAIPETLAESQLFGVKAGAFTGADKSRIGYVEASDKGTLYLDEIDSMPLHLQAKLLRMIETRGVEQLGSVEFRPLDLRIIVSTKTPFPELVSQGKFRADLYYRLSTVVLNLPSLKERTEVILPLLSRFLRASCQRMNRPMVDISNEARVALLSHSWPGNVRELKSVADRIALGLPALPGIDTVEEKKTDLKDVLKRVEETLIREALDRHDGCINSITEELGMPKRTFYNRIKSLNIH